MIQRIIKTKVEICNCYGSASISLHNIQISTLLEQGR